MRFIIAILVLVSSANAAEFKPSPFAGDQLEFDKNECLKHSDIRKKEPSSRHPELSHMHPDAWDQGFSGCEQIWQKWHDRAEAERQRIEREQPLRELDKAH